MKALLDEQLSPQIASLLRQDGFDVVAGAERPELVGSSDWAVLEVAASEGRAVVTSNIKDFRPLAAERLASGRTHPGLVLLPSARARTRAALAVLAESIAQVLRDNQDGLGDREVWIGPLACR